MSEGGRGRGAGERMEEEEERRGTCTFLDSFKIKSMGWCCTVKVEMGLSI